MGRMKKCFSTPGDWLNHPRLGMCCVVLSDGEERVKCRLSSGRVAELMLSLFRLKAAGVKEGGRIYDVEVRKKALANQGRI